MNIAIIDAELISSKNHRFPNLASMKLSGYNKRAGNKVILKLDYNNLDQYDKVYISKVFTATKLDESVLKLPNVEYGGTGFFYDKAIPLPHEIEHHMPDYHLYDEWVDEQLKNGTKIKDMEYYTNHSIGYLTRKCFRGCYYCVNRNYKKVEVASPLNEFLDDSRKHICLLDDNFFGFPEWKQLIQELQSTGKKFQFKQGLDERLLTEEKVKILDSSKYYGDYIFAFDNIEDKDIIIEKLKLWRKHSNATAKFYVFCGCDKNEIYDEEFWRQDIINTFERIKILMEYKCIPYIMRFEEYENSPYRGTYINLARWCNQPSIFKKMTYRIFCEENEKRSEKPNCSAMRYFKELESKYPEIAQEYFDLKY